MNKTFEINIIIGTSLLAPMYLLAKDESDWIRIEKEKTFYTEERYLPKILVGLGIYPSISEIRRNKPELMMHFREMDFIDSIKVSKKRKLWIVVGE